MSAPAARTSVLRFLRSRSGRVSPWWLGVTFLGLMMSASIVGTGQDDTTTFGSAIGTQIESEALPEFNPNRL